METKDLNAKKYLELAGNIYAQALEECKELLRSRGDKCYIYVTCEEKDNMIYLNGDGAMDFGWFVGVGLDGDNLLYCAYPYNDIPATIEAPWQVFDNGCYLCLESMPEVYSFIVGNLDKSVTKEEAIAVQEKDYDEYGLGQMPDFSFGWDSDDEDEDADEDSGEDVNSDSDDNSTDDDNDASAVAATWENDDELIEFARKYVREGLIGNTLEGAQIAISEHLYKAAVVLYDEASDVQDEWTPDDYNQHAWACYEIGEYEKALPIATKAVELSNNSSIIDTLATIYDAMGRYDEALTYYMKAMETSISEGNQEFADEIAAKIDAVKAKMKH